MTNGQRRMGLGIAEFIVATEIAVCIGGTALAMDFKMWGAMCLFALMLVLLCIVLNELDHERKSIELEAEK